MKTLVADLRLDKHILREVLSKNLKPAVRRELVSQIRQGYQLSENRACGLVGITRWIHRYRSQREPQTELRMRPTGTGGQQSSVWIPLPEAARPNQRWSMDFVSDRLTDGRWFRILTVVDQYTRECLCIDADRSQTGGKVVEHMKRLAATPRTVISRASTAGYGTNASTRRCSRV